MIKDQKISLISAIFLAAVVFGVWTVASPIGSAPDDDFHLPAIWCGVGERDGFCEPESKMDGRGLTPLPLSAAPQCFAFRSDVSAACQSDTFSWDDTSLVDSRTNEIKRFPNGFYAFLNFFISSNLIFSILAMRMINSLLFIFLFVATFFSISSSLRPSLIISWLVTLIPLGIYTIASTNPSSWIIVGLGFFWINLLNMIKVKQFGKDFIFSILLVFITALIALLSRSEASIYIPIAITATLIISYKALIPLNPFNLSKLLAIFSVFAASLILFARTPSSLGVSTGLPGGDPNRSLQAVWFSNILEFPVLIYGSFGAWSLGWLDTPISKSVFFSIFLVFSGILFGSFKNISKAKFAALIFLMGSTAFITLRVLALGKNLVGENVQPRYLLPLLIVLIGVALIPDNSIDFSLDTSQLFLVATLVSIAHSIALHNVMRRYITGTDVVGINLNSSAEWWWFDRMQPMMFWVIGSTAFLLLCFYLVTIAKSTLIKTTNGLTK